MSDCPYCGVYLNGTANHDILLCARLTTTPQDTSTPLSAGKPLSAFNAVLTVLSRRHVYLDVSEADAIDQTIGEAERQALAAAGFCEAHWPVDLDSLPRPCPCCLAVEARREALEKAEMTCEREMSDPPVEEPNGYMRGCADCQDAIRALLDAPKEK